MQINRFYSVIIFLTVLGLIGYFVFNQSSEVKLEKKDNSFSVTNEKVTIIEEDEALGRKIMTTDGVKHSVPLEEIKFGGPDQDEIPPIDNPKFIGIAEAEDFLDDNEPGIALSLEGENRFYPYQILVWHEIVNDTIKDQPVLIAYCPLCLTGIVFDPVVQGERVEFGTSGKLWKSNLVMYDRKTESYWSQILGEAILGPETGNKLKVIASDQILFGKWKSKFPNGEVLSKDTGNTHFYGQNPYGDYFSAQDFAVDLAGFDDKRLSRDAFIFGIIVNGKAKAYVAEKIKTQGNVEDEFEGKKFALEYDNELNVVRVYEVDRDGKKIRINPVSGFWFNWASAYPNTKLYK